MHNSEWLHALWLLPALAALYTYGFHRKSVALRTFIREPGLLPVLNVSVSRPRQIAKAALVLVALGLIAVALARPRWNPQPEAVATLGARRCVRLGRIAQHVGRGPRSQPLGAGKAGHCMDVLDTLEGDRVGLVAFAGTAVVKSPLTLDYSFMRLALRDLAPESVSRGGTLIGDAIRVAPERGVRRQRARVQGHHPYHRRRRSRELPHPSCRAGRRGGGPHHRHRSR